MHDKSSEKIFDIINQCLKYNEIIKEEGIDDIIKISKERIDVFEKEYLKKKNVNIREKEIKKSR